MLTPRSVFLTALITALLSLVLGTWQAKSPQQQTAVSSQKEASESNPPNRTIWISIQSKNGAPSELSASDLDVKLDGKPTAVRDIRRVSPALRYCLLLDVSGSTRSTLNTQHDEAVALLSRIPQAGRDYGVLVAFNDQAYLDAEGTDPQKLIKNINQDARGSTAMYDAMVACSDHLANNVLSTAEPDTLNVMVVLSDGVDNSSRSSREDAERALISERMRVYSVGQEGVSGYRPELAARASKSLKQLVDLTGGKDYLLTKKMTLDQIVQDISHDLASLYVVTLSSETTVPRDHVYKLDVRCGKKNCAVAAPREYFLPLR